MCASVSVFYICKNVLKVENDCDNSFMAHRVNSWLLRQLPALPGGRKLSLWPLRAPLWCTFWKVTVLVLFPIVGSQQSRKELASFGIFWR